MKIKLTFISLIGLATLIIISSCATTHPNQTYIVGNWKPQAAEKYVPPAKPAKVSSVPADTEKMKKSSVPVAKVMTVEDQQKAAQLERMIATELRSPVSVKTEGKKHIVEKFYPGKTATGTWKMKRNGQRVTIKEQETGKKMIMDLVSITDTNAVVIERFPYGDIKVTYLRVKKLR